jgi:hypothetical protein
VVSEEARKAGGAAAEVAAVPKPGKEDALVARLDVTAPKTGGAVVTACSKAPNPVVEIAAVSEEARKAGGASAEVAAVPKPKEEDIIVAAGGVPKLNPKNKKGSLGELTFGKL